MEIKLYKHPLIYRLVNNLFSLTLTSRIRKRVLERFSNKRILEVGIGYENPIYSQEVGVDVSKEMLKHSKEFCQVCQASAYNLPFKEDSFDLVFFSFSLCVLEDPLSALKEAKRIGKDVVILEYSKPRWLSKKLWRIGDQAGRLVYGSKNYSKLLEKFKVEEYGVYALYFL